ncbi:MobC family plasmid mobilization relaxosome protein [Streptomyces sp. A 4/2]|uniref:MobC family plasmid mobilization relaxosome protein n=1 Tax=Streptomyces sp. A 4/2 TaxID=2934314 RepID=UPI0020242D9A|nr:MobC family plasmid mobilization relaxosome protein [Streptomyces sp. A 4/2]
MAGEPTVKSAQPTIRRFTGTKRTARVGPLRFTADEHTRLQEAAAEHGYKGDSGLAADIVLAFIDGRFTANLPLSEERRRTHHFRAQVLRQLNRIGVNVNQIARALNSDLTPPDIRQHLTELQQLLELIAEALREPAVPDEGEAAA